LFSFDFLGKDLPIRMSGPRMTTTKNKKQLLMTHKKGVYSFKCHSSDDCYWEEKNQELQISRTHHIMMKVPASMVENCWYSKYLFKIIWEIKMLINTDDNSYI